MMLTKCEIYQALNDTFNGNHKWRTLSKIGDQAILAIDLQAELANLKETNRMLDDVNCMVRKYKISPCRILRIIRKVKDDKKNNVATSDIDKVIEDIGAVSGILQYALIESDPELTEKIPNYLHALDLAITALQRTQGE